MKRVKIIFLSFCANSKQLTKYLQKLYIIGFCVLGGCGHPGPTQLKIEATPKPPPREKPTITTFEKTISHTLKRKPLVPNVSLDIKTFLGKDIKFITFLLGKPKFLRHDPPSKLWRYTTNSCILDFFAYSPKKTNAPKVYSVTFFEARTAKGKKIPETVCLNTIYKNYRRQSIK